MSASQFEFLGFPHIAAMGVTLALPILLAIVVKRLNSAKATQAICGAFAAVLLAQRDPALGPPRGDGWGVRVCAVVPAVARL